MGDRTGIDRQQREGLAVTRRRFLTWTGAAAAVAFTPGLLGVDKANKAAAAEPAKAPALQAYPFTLGVASGDPRPSGVVLWTRLATDPLAPSGGMEAYPVPVRWQVAEDENFRRVVRDGITSATPDWGHSVHVEVNGLTPWRDYFYRFQVGSGANSYDSPIARTKTAPQVSDRLGSLSLAYVSCQAWHNGFYTAYADLAAGAPDVVFHVGDYIYENAQAAVDPVRGVALPSRFGHEATTLEDYRDRYALYRSDPDLRAAHAAAPWVVAFDDHEVDNNWAGQISENNDDPAVFLLRRAAAFRAYYENQPMRAPQRPQGPDIQLYRRLTYGNLLQFHVLDTRQYRDDQADGDGYKPPNPESLDPTRSIMGQAQEAWLLDGFSRRPRWTVLAHQVPMLKMDTARGAEEILRMDQWDGYVPCRNRILGGAYDRGVRNLVSIVGDMHRNMASDLKADFADPASPLVGTEFAGTSISTGGDGENIDDFGQTVLAENEHLKYYNIQRGYVSCTITPDQWETTYRVADVVTQPGGTMSTHARFVVEDGHPTIQQA